MLLVLSATARRCSSVAAVSKTGGVSTLRILRSFSSSSSLHSSASSTTTSTTHHTNPPIATPIVNPPTIPLPEKLPLDSIIKVFTVASSPNHFLPWQNKSSSQATGSGFLAEGNRLLTNAHVVADCTHVTVRKHGDPNRYMAKVVAVAHDCDLAELKVEDESFLDGMKALEFGGVPELRDPVAVVGYPTGGENISVTTGVVSRVEPQRYAHGASHLLAVQIDAAINPGNSGGPAFQGNKVVGIAFQNLDGAENIGFIIPVPIIRHFFDDLSRNAGQYIGFGALGIRCQDLENVDHRDYLKMKKNHTGVLISSVLNVSPNRAKLQKGDVLLEIDGHVIANDGTVHFRSREHISFDYVVSTHHVGEQIPLKILRNGEETTVFCQLDAPPVLVPVHMHDKMPSYFIWGGLVFVPLTQAYLHEYGNDWYDVSPRVLCYRALQWEKRKENEQIVILSHILPDEANHGFEGFANLQVKTFNDQPIENLETLVRLASESTDEYFRLGLDDQREIVMKRRRGEEAETRIKTRYRVPQMVSDDMVPFYNKKQSSGQ